jgi:hypothetical protein
MSEPTAVMTNAAPPLSAGRILRALLAGACTGSLLTTGGMFLGADRSAPAVTLLYTLPYVLVGTFIAFSVGIVALGVPGWWILHRFGYRNWPAALALGMALTSIGYVALALDPLIWPAPNSTFSAGDAGGLTIIDNKMTTHGWIQLFMEAFAISWAGGIAGVVVWRIAYVARRQDAPSRDHGPPDRAPD